MYKIPASTLFMGKNLVYVPECHSTNTLASDLCQRTSPVEGTIVITDNQTMGRGQRGNVWHSDAFQNLTFSLILKPSFLRPVDQFNLTMAISLAVCDFLIHRDCDEVKIKWPNDILIKNKKVCGILIENTLSGDQLQCSVIGIGLNVNQDSFLVESASSMKLLTGRRFNLSDECSTLCGFVERRYLQLKAGGLAALKSDYLNSLYGLGVMRRFIFPSCEMNGVIEGVNQHGKLLVAIEGEVVAYDLKEIQFAR